MVRTLAKIFDFQQRRGVIITAVVPRDGRQKMAGFVLDFAQRSQPLAGFHVEARHRLQQGLEIIMSGLAEDMVQGAAFQNLAVFSYSPEEGSPAASLPGRVPHEEARRRRDHLMALQESVSERVLAARVGQRQRILVGGCEEDGSWYGRTWFQAPEIDGLTWLGTASPGPAGSMVDAEVTGSSVHDLYAEVLDPATASPIDAAPRHD